MPMIDSHELVELLESWQVRARALSEKMVNLFGDGPNIHECGEALGEPTRQINEFVIRLGGRPFLSSDPKRWFNDQDNLHLMSLMIQRIIEQRVVPATLASVLRYHDFARETRALEEQFELVDPGVPDQPRTFVCYSLGDAMWARLVATSVGAREAVWFDQYLGMSGRELPESTINTVIDSALANIERLYVCYSFEWVTQAGYAHREFLSTLLGSSRDRRVELTLVTLDECPVLSVFEGAPRISLLELVGHDRPVAGVPCDELGELRVERARERLHERRGGPEQPALSLDVTIESRQVYRALVAAAESWDHSPEALSSVLEHIDPVLEGPTMQPGHLWLDSDLYRSLTIRALSIGLRAHCTLGGVDAFAHIPTAWAYMNRLLELEGVRRVGPVGTRLSRQDVLTTNQHYLDALYFLVATWFQRWTPSIMACVSKEEYDDDERLDKAVMEQILTRAKELGDILLDLRLVEVGAIS